MKGMMALISCGVVLSRVLQAADRLIEQGIDPMIISVPTLKPFDEKLIGYAARKTGAIVTCEEHSIIGGLGSAVCETVAKSCPVPVERLGIPDVFAESGTFDQLLDRYGLSVEGMIKAAKDVIRRKD